MGNNRIVVLVVEDEALLRLGIVDYLEDAGFTVFEAANATQAVEILVQNPQIAILFTDIDMPGGMDGLMLAAAVRDRWPPIQIVVTSGHRRVDQADLPARAQFLPKPYNPAALVANLRELAAH
ncbi:response regulator [Devosia sp.]|uniref:response regulator n=1 Tax=Devosia sp. TaxID=1871048 RepID=UPI00326572F5